MVRVGRRKRGNLRYIRKRRRNTKKQTLTKTVNALVKASKSTGKVIRLATYTSGLPVSANFNQFPICPIQSADRIFGTGSNDLHSNHSKWIKSHIQLQISAEAEKQWTGLTVFLVSLKNSIPDTKFNGSTGALSLTANQDYYMTQGMTYLNKDNFNIHYYKQFQFNSDSDTGKTTFTKSFTLRPNCKIVNPNGDWSALEYPQKPTQNYYVLIFNNNSLVDLESPYYKMNVVNTFISP